MIRAIVASVLAAIFLWPSPPAEAGTTTVYYSVSASVTHYPVGAAVDNWNQNSLGIRMYRVADCTPTYVPCVRVFEQSVSNFFNSGGEYYVVSDGTWEGRIRLTYHAALSQPMRQEAICHELGHFYQVPHSNHGCMEPYIDGTNPHPYAGNYNRSIMNPPMGWRG